MAGPWADLVAGERIRRTPAGWPSRPLTPSDTRKFIRLWVKALYQMTRGVQEALVQDGQLLPNSGGAPDIELCAAGVLQHVLVLADAGPLLL